MKAKNSIIIGSILANVILAAILLGPKQADHGSRSKISDKAPNVSPPSKIEERKRSDAKVPPGNAIADAPSEPESLAVISLGPQELGNLITSDADSFYFSESIYQSLDIPLKAVDQLHDLSIDWMKEIKQLELDGKTTVSENGETYFIISPEKERLKKLYERIRSEIRNVPQIKHSDLIADMLIANPRVASLEAPREFGFTVDDNNIVSFVTPDQSVSLSLGKGTHLDDILNQYGHLFNFSSWEGKPNK